MATANVLTSLGAADLDTKQLVSDLVNAVNIAFVYPFSVGIFNSPDFLPVHHIDSVRILG